MIEADPSGRFVLAADLGLDRILVWRFDDVKGTLTPNDPPWVALPPGDGPRHFAFHPKGRWFYSLQEEASTIVRFDYDASSGRLDARQTLSTLPSGFAGTNFTSEILVSPDARFVYVANRLHDSIAWFSDRRRWHAEVGRGGMDARRLSPQLRHRSVRAFAVLVQPAIGRDCELPYQREVGSADVHRAVHAGRLSRAHRLSELADPSAKRSAKQIPGDALNPLIRAMRSAAVRPWQHVSGRIAHPLRPENCRRIENEVVLWSRINRCRPLLGSRSADPRGAFGDDFNPGISAGFP